MWEHAESALSRAHVTALKPAACASCHERHALFWPSCRRARARGAYACARLLPTFVAACRPLLHAPAGVSRVPGQSQGARQLCRVAFPDRLSGDGAAHRGDGAHRTRGHARAAVLGRRAALLLRRLPRQSGLRRARRRWGRRSARAMHSAAAWVRQSALRRRGRVAAGAAAPGGPRVAVPHGTA